MPYPSRPVRWARLSLVSWCFAALLVGCAAREGDRPRPLSPSLASGALPASAPDTTASLSSEPWPDGERLGLTLAPDPQLQALIDPIPAGPRKVWLGGDIAASVAVAPAELVWLFGDTILGTIDEGCSAGGARCSRGRTIDAAPDDVVANSAGTMRFRAPERPAPIVKVWRREAAGRPAPVLETAVPGELVWPLAGARVGGVLVLALSIHSREAGLVPLGNSLAVVSNPRASPDRWRVEVHEMPNVRTGVGETAPLVWTTALVRDEPHLYIVGQRGVGLAARSVLARMPTAGIGRRGWTPQPEVLLAREGGGIEWSRALDPEALYEIPGLPGTSEATFEYRDGLGWITFQIAPFAFEVHAFTAPALWGPWTDRGVVYQVPPPWSTEVRGDCATPEIACGWERFAVYAVKSHPELAPPGGFALTYNVNVLFGTLESAIDTSERFPGFYVPRMIAGGEQPRPRP